MPELAYPAWEPRAKRASGLTQLTVHLETTAATPGGLAKESLVL